MPPEASGYPSDWLRIAEKDLDRVGRNMRDDPEENDIFASFHQVTDLIDYLKGNISH